MRKFLPILICFFLANNALAANDLTANVLKEDICQSEVVCDAYFLGYLDGLGAGSFVINLKPSSNVSAMTLKHLFMRIVNATPQAGDMPAAIVNAGILNEYGYATEITAGKK